MRLNLSSNSWMLLIVYFLIGISIVNCWEDYELDLFDLVEEVGENFYEFFGVDPNCDQNEIKRAYRKLSLLWHPDRSSDPDAEKKFRQIVSINDVLKDEVKRARYNEILIDGLPDWRQPIYYFRRVRKMSFSEIAVALGIIVSIGHYFVLWAQHFEKKLTLDDQLGEVRKKLEKKQKKGGEKKKKFADLDELDEALQKCYDSLPKPTVKDTLPYRFASWTFSILISLPFLVKDILKSKMTKEEVEVDLQEEEELDRQQQKAKRAVKSRLHLELNPKTVEKSNIAAPIPNYEQKQSEQTSETNDLNKKSKEWSDKEKSDLIKGIAKFPPGAVNRWVKIGEFVGRSQQECIQMEKMIKSNFTSSTHSNLNANSWIQTKATNLLDQIEPTSASNETTNSQNALSKDVPIDQWTQDQQSQLEKALKEINKDAPNRWEKIAEAVPGKTKEECINRYKVLCATLIKKKQTS